MEQCNTATMQTLKMEQCKNAKGQQCNMVYLVCILVGWFCSSRNQISLHRSPETRTLLARTLISCRQKPEPFSPEPLSPETRTLLAKTLIAGTLIARTLIAEP